MPTSAHVITRVTTPLFTLPTNTAENDILTFTPSSSTNIIKGIWLDLVNLTQSVTIRLYYRIDATTERLFQTITWTTAQDDGVLIEGDIPVYSRLRLTIQSGTAEAATRSVPYELFFQGLGRTTLFTYTVTRSDTGAPLDGVQVSIYTDSGAATNLIASGVTDSLGQISLSLDPGTYYFRRSLAGYNFSPEPDSETVS